jgi:hypothetical protein
MVRKRGQALIRWYVKELLVSRRGRPSTGLSRLPLSPVLISEQSAPLAARQQMSTLRLCFSKL